MAERFSNWSLPSFDDKNLTKWNWMCQHHENLNLGDKVDIGAFCYLNAKKGISIDSEVQIGSHCSLYTESTIDNKEGPISIGKNSRIGSHSIVMPNVKIGENSTIGAFSFVNKDIPDNSLAYGVPVKVVEKFD